MSEPNSITNLIGTFGSIIGFFLSLSPFILYYKVYKNQLSVKSIPISMIIFNLLGGVVWLCYWVKKQTLIPLLSTGINFIIHNISTMFYIYFSVEGKIKKFISTYLLVILISYILYYIDYNFVKDEKKNGTIAMIFCVITYIAPGQNLLKVIKVGDYKLIPISTTILGILCSGSWMLFGILTKDINNIVPGIIGIIFSTINSFVYIYFYRNRAIEKTNDVEITVEIEKKKQKKNEGFEKVEIKNSDDKK